MDISSQLFGVLIVKGLLWLGISLIFTLSGGIFFFYFIKTNNSLLTEFLNSNIEIMRLKINNDFISKEEHKKKHEEIVFAIEKSSKEMQETFRATVDALRINIQEKINKDTELLENKIENKAGLSDVEFRNIKSEIKELKLKIA